MRKTLLWTCVLSLSLAVSLPALAQDAPQERPERTAGDPATRPAPLSQQVVRTFYLANVSRASDMQDVVNAMRTILEFQRVQQIPSLHALVLRGSAEQMAMAEKVIRDIDKPRAESSIGSYKLDVELHEFENGKRVGTRSYAMMVQRGSGNHDAEWSRYRVGSRVPVTTGANPSQVQYMDIGVNIDSRLWGSDNELMLESTVEVSSLASPQGAAENSHPIVRQTKATSFTALAAGKPTLIGSLDGVDSARRTEIEVTATKLK